MAKKTFTSSELSKLSAEQVINKIIYENYSLLDTFGAKKLRREMVPVGKLCTRVLDFCIASTGPKDNIKEHNYNARKKLVRILEHFTPAEYANFLKDDENGLVVGFNHPSLGEIPRILMMKIDTMGEKKMLFPVNLPWYEALAGDFDKIRRFGIIITPTITPATWGKLDLKEGSKLYDEAMRLKKGFRKLYTQKSYETIKNGGVIFVAPSATRQVTVFKNKAVYDKKEDVIPTMSVLALELFQDPEIRCNFLPLAVQPAEGFKRNLNLGKTYRLIPGEMMTADYIRKTYFKTKNPKRLEGFDYDFHQRIADELPKKFWY